MVSKIENVYFKTQYGTVLAQIQYSLAIQTRTAKLRHVTTVLLYCISILYTNTVFNLELEQNL